MLQFIRIFGLYAETHKASIKHSYSPIDIPVTIKLDMKFNYKFYHNSIDSHQDSRHRPPPQGLNFYFQTPPKPQEGWKPTSEWTTPASWAIPLLEIN